MQQKAKISYPVLWGMNYKLIANECTISNDMVNVHIKNIYKKLQVHSKSEAVVKAIKGKIV